MNPCFWNICLKEACLAEKTSLSSLPPKENDWEKLFKENFTISTTVSFSKSFKATKIIAFHFFIFLIFFIENHWIPTYKLSLFYLLKLLHIFTKAQIKERNFTSESAWYMLYFKRYIFKSNFKHTAFETFVSFACYRNDWFSLVFSSLLNFSSSRWVLKNNFRCVVSALTCLFETIEEKK